VSGAADAGGLVVRVTTTTGRFSVEADLAAGDGITALFGPSGAGKSLTLATVAGLLRPSMGTVALDGTVLADAGTGLHVPTQQRRIGMVFQEATLLPQRSPLDNVAVALKGGSRAERRERALTWLDRVHAAHLAEAPTRTLSGGEQQRVALARALVGEPRLLLLDEPFSALDLRTRRSLRTLVADLVAEDGLVALMVTHDPHDVRALADAAVTYEPGRTVATHVLRTGTGAPVDTVALAAVLGLTDQPPSAPDRSPGAPHVR